MPEELWHPAGTIDFPMPVHDAVGIPSDNHTIHNIIRYGKKVDHWVRGSVSPFPWEKLYTLPGNYQGCGYILRFTKDGNYLIGWPKLTPEGANGKLVTWWAKPSLFPDPSHPSPPPLPKLVVSGGVLRWGDTIQFAGASDRCALIKETEEYPDIALWSDPNYKLAEYENDLIESGINYVRHIGSMNTQFMIDHVLRMRAAGIVVEIEVYDPNLIPNPFVNLSEMWKLAILGNTLFDVGNEFRAYEPAIGMVKSICDQLLLQNCLVGAGAWSAPGQGYSQTFHNEYNKHTYETAHRHWVESHWRIALDYLPHKPVMANEIFNLTNMSLAAVESLFGRIFQVGCQGGQYYHWGGLPDQLAFKDVLDVASKFVN